MITPFTFQKWVSRSRDGKTKNAVDFYDELVPAYGEKFNDTEYGIALNCELYPVVDLKKVGRIELRSAQICVAEWTTFGKFVYQANRIGLGKDDGYVFVELPDPVDEPNVKDSQIIGFVMHSDALYDVHAKTRVKGKIPGVKRRVEVESSKKGKYWEVLVYEDKTMSCNCPAWKFMRDGKRHCKHVAKVERDGI